MLLLDDLLLAPGRAMVALFEQLAKRAQDEFLDDAVVKQELHEIHSLLEGGQISETEFEGREGRLLERLEQIMKAKLQGGWGSSLSLSAPTDATFADIAAFARNLASPAEDTLDVEGDLDPSAMETAGMSWNSMPMVIDTVAIAEDPPEPPMKYPPTDAPIGPDWTTAPGTSDSGLGIRDSGLGARDSGSRAQSEVRNEVGRLSFAIADDPPPPPIEAVAFTRDVAPAAIAGRHPSTPAFEPAAIVCRHPSTPPFEPAAVAYSYPPTPAPAPAAIAYSYPPTPAFEPAATAYSYPPTPAPAPAAIAYSYPPTPAFEPAATAYSYPPTPAFEPAATAYSYPPTPAPAPAAIAYGYPPTPAPEPAAVAYSYPPAPAPAPPAPVFHAMAAPVVPTVSLPQPGHVMPTVSIPPLFNAVPTASLPPPVVNTLPVQPAPPNVTAPDVPVRATMNQAADAAVRGLSMLKMRVSSITSVVPNGEGWQVTVELVERKSVPDSSDLLGVYETFLDTAGNLLRYERTRIRRRSDIGG